MPQFTQPELFDTINQYVANEDNLLATLRDSVVEWRYANDEMFGLHPLFAEISSRNGSKWKPANRRWLKKKSAGFCYLHGLDANGEITLIERSNGITTAIIRTDSMVDQMTFGGRATALICYLIEFDRTVAMYEYRLDPHQYSYEEFEYEDGHCVRSHENSWYVSEGQWKPSFPHASTMQYDSGGLAQVTVEAIGGVFGPEVVFVRPPAKQRRQARKPSTTGKPFFGYSVALLPGTDSEYELTTDAYGLEMYYDDEWSVETVVFVPPHLVAVLARDTGLKSEGVAAGSTGMPLGGALVSLVDAGATWIMLFANESDTPANLYDATQAGLGVVLVTADAHGLAELAAQAPALTPDKLVIALRPHDPAGAQALAASVRTNLVATPVGGSRLVLAVNPAEVTGIANAAHNDLDGLFLMGGRFDNAVELLQQLAAT